MIKYTANLPPDRVLVGLGLDKENVRRLQAGQPILVRLAEMGIPGDIEILIHYGESVSDIFRELEEMIGPETKVQVSKNL